MEPIRGIDVPETGGNRRKLERGESEYRSDRRCEMNKETETKRNKTKQNGGERKNEGKVKERRRARKISPEENNDTNYTHQIIDSASMASDEEDVRKKAERKGSYMETRNKTKRKSREQAAVHLFWEPHSLSMDSYTRTLPERDTN